MRDRLLDLFEAEATARLTRARVTLDLLSSHPAGIGDHSTEDFYSNARAAFREYLDANDELAAVTELRTRRDW